MSTTRSRIQSARCATWPRADANNNKYYYYNIRQIAVVGGGEEGPFATAQYSSCLTGLTSRYHNRRSPRIINKKKKKILKNKTRLPLQLTAVVCFVTRRVLFARFRRIFRPPPPPPPSGSSNNNNNIHRPIIYIGDSRIIVFSPDIHILVRAETSEGFKYVVT